MLIVRHATRLFSLSRATFNLMEECMYGLSLIRLGLFIALAIIASTAIGLFTYVVVSALAEYRHPSIDDEINKTIIIRGIL